MRGRTKLGLALGAVGAAAAVALSLSVEPPPEAEIVPVHEPPRRDLGQEDCPPGDDGAGMGPRMERLGDYCVDATEVSRAQYAAWLDTSPATSGQPAACADNDDFTPTCAWPPGGSDGARPVVCVDWCDARAFCEAAGKRLCGAIGGGDYAFDDYDDPAVSEWHAACTADGAHPYPYGDDYEPLRCRSGDADDHTQWGVVDVGSLDGCRAESGPHAEVRDLSGNVAEWDGACDGDGPDAPCRIRGGSWQHNERGLRCDMARDLRWPRTRAVEAVGFRCCAD